MARGGGGGGGIPPSAAAPAASATHQRLAAQLEELARGDLLRRRLTLSGAQGARITVDGADFLAFCSNDYLGLANHPAIAQAAIDAVRRHGVGAGASHLVTGHSIAHERLEERLAGFVAMPRALLFASGYQANIGAVAALAGRDDAVFSDALNHASLIDGMRLSRSQVVTYPHRDTDALAEALRSSRARTRLVATDSVFSMDGDLAPLPELLELCERFDALLLVDDAHGFGVLGREGRGALAHFGMASPRIVYVGTLGKAAGVAGAFVAGAPEVIETILQGARSYLFSTASPPLLAAAVEASLELIRGEEWRRERLRALVDSFQRRLRAIGVVAAASRTPIQPLIAGSNAAALAVSAALRARGILVPAIRPPTVPEGTARLRVSLSASHDEDDLAQLIAALGASLPKQAA